MAIVLLCLAVIPTQSLAANRSLKLYFTHTKETATIVYKRNGKFDADGLRKLNRFLRDWRRNESTQMDPALFDLIWQVYKDTGAKKPIHVVSAYRSPATNNMLRRRSRGVAQNSRHTKGQAMDFYLPGVSVKAIRNAGLRIQAGGVGYYPSSRSPFVHIDTGNVRHWPRMSRKQLAKVFPRGKTVHVPRDGKPFSGYKVAKAQVAKRKANMIRSSRSVRRFRQVAKAAPSTKRPSKVQLAKLSQSKTKKETSLLQSLLKRTPKTPPKPTFDAKVAPAPINLQETATDVPPNQEPINVMPRKLATMPRRPQNRPAPKPEAPATVVEPVPQPETVVLEIAVAKAEVDTAVEAKEPVLLASLPRARPKSTPRETFQLASAAPITEPKSLEQLQAEQTTQEKAPADQATLQAAVRAVDELPVAEETPATNNEVILASLPKARLVSEERAQTLVSQALPNQTAPDSNPEKSATDILATLTNDPSNEGEAEPSNRFAYAASDDAFIAALPSQRPRTLLVKDPVETGFPALPQNANRTQLASLTQDAVSTPEATQSALAALPRAARQSTTPSARLQKRRTPATNQLERLTFAYGPSGMSHFAHMKQSTKTSTFARLSPPIPSNLRSLVSKPNSMINQTFSHRPNQLLQDARFAGAAIARMAVRSFK